MKKHLSAKQRQKALDLMKEIRRLSDAGPSVLRGLSESEILRRMRKTRERLWEEKIASLASRR